MILESAYNMYKNKSAGPDGIHLRGPKKPRQKIAELYISQFLLPSSTLMPSTVRRKGTKITQIKKKKKGFKEE